MSKPFSIHDIELLGYVDVQEDKNVKDLPYQSYSCSAIAGIKKIKTNFIYLKSNCTKKEAEEVAHTLKKYTDNYIVIPKSIGIKHKSLEEIFGPQLFIFEEIIWDKIKSTFEDYNNSLGSSIATEKYYVPPRKQIREGKVEPKDRLDDELIGYLTGIQDLNGNLIVVSASAGVGKTTLARQLTVDLSKSSEKYKLIPAYVEASHWGKLRVDSISELWEVIDNSIRAFCPNLTISEQIFEHSLKHGNLVFIFDGFDELCGHNSSHFRPGEILEKLANLCKDSNAKVILTTRTLYWESEIDSPPDNVRLLELAPFNSQQAKNYFSKYFHNDPKARERGVSLYSDLIQQSGEPRNEGGPRSQFVNLPLCVGMIAEYVRLGGTGYLSKQSSKGLVYDILYQICERERARKKLSTSAEDQISAFGVIAVEKLDEFLPKFVLDDLVIVGFEEEDLPRLIDHPLVRSSDESHYTFSYDFLTQYLRALYLSDAVKACDHQHQSDVWKIMCKESNGKGYLIEHMLVILNNDVSNIREIYRKIPAKYIEAKSFIFHLIKQSAYNSTFIVTKNEKTKAIFSAIDENYTQNKIVKSIYIVGNIDGLDLGGVKFIEGSFIDASFTRCNVDENTIFANCRFYGNLDFQGSNRNEWSMVKLEDCTMLPPSNLVWEEIKGQIFNSREEHLLDAMLLALNKFWHHGILKKSIKKENWRRGGLSYSIYCDVILESMLRTGLIEDVPISGLTKGGYAFSADSVSDLQRFMDNRQLTGKIREVFDYILKS